jgi:hypothetical protein
MDPDPKLKGLDPVPALDSEMDFNLIKITKKSFFCKNCFLKCNF